MTEPREGYESRSIKFQDLMHVCKSIACNAEFEAHWEAVAVKRRWNVRRDFRRAS